MVSATRLERCFDQQFWIDLCPELSITTHALNEIAGGAGNDCGRLELEEFAEMLREDGYFTCPAWLQRQALDELSVAFDRIVAEGFPPVFSFVFDQPWDLMCQMQPLVQSVVGDHLWLPAIWAWHVSAESQTGFKPHRDQVRDVMIDDEDHLDYLTVWVPVTDLDHRTSSISLLPASCDPDFEEGTEKIRVENLQDIRSLQGSAGSVFCWSTQIAHWGTTHSGYGPPRKSVAFYLQKPDVECMDGPPIDFSQPISFEERLAMIGRQVIDYSRTATDEELKLAKRLISLG